MTKKRDPRAAPATASAPPAPPPAAGRAVALAATWGGPALIAATSVVMLLWSWRKWPDILIDFGRELYVPWQLTAGRVLYVDLEQFLGPLSSYWNAMWFRLCGVSLTTLIVVNLVLLALLMAMMYRLLAAVGSRLSATAALVVFATLFAFAQFVGIGNYNYVCPYTHEVTHAMVLSVAGIYFLARFLRGRRWVDLAAVGMALGLLMLTKVEMFVGGAAAMAAGVGLDLVTRRPPWRQAARELAVLEGGALLPCAVAFALMVRIMPAKEALKALLTSWPLIFGTGLTENIFYSQGMGFDQPGENIVLMLQWAGWYGLFIGGAVLAGLALRSPARWHLALAGIVGIGVAVGLGMAWKQVPWFDAARPLPLAMLLTAVVCLVMLARRRSDEAERVRWILRLALVTLALALLPKMLLNTRIYHYGFVMAMPAALLLVVAMVDWIPWAVARGGGYGGVARAVGLALLVVAVGVHVYVMSLYFARKTVPAGTGGDTIMAGPHGRAVNAVLEELARRAKPGQTLSVVPEGITINYLARMPNSTRFAELMPTSILTFGGEDRIVDDYDRHPPDFIAIVHKDTREFGEGFFGSGYGLRLTAWIGRNYTPVWLAGAMPNTSENFGILLLERKKPGTTP